MKILLSTLNCSYIHRNLGLRWLKVASDSFDDVTIKEFTINEDYQNMLDYYINQENEVLGFGVYIYNVSLIKRLIVDIKLHRRNLRLIVGGPEVTYDQEWLDLGVEAIIVGEAELSFYQYLKYNHADGVMSANYCSDVEFAITPIEHLESLKSPYFMEEDEESYTNQFFYLETSRGCPYNCIYCFSANRDGVRYFSKDYLEPVFKRLFEHKAKQIKVLDRTFNSDTQHAISVSRWIDRFEHSYKFHMEIEVDKMTTEYFNYLMQEATSRRYRFEIGIQSFNNFTLKSINRTQDNQLVKHRINLLNAKGFTLHVDLIVGLPYEDYKSFCWSFSEVYALHVSEIQVGILKLLKNTPLYQQNYRNDFTFNKQPPYNVLKNRWLSVDEIRRLQYLSLAVEKLYNKRQLTNTFNFINKYGIDIVNILVDLGAAISALNKPYSRCDLFKAMFNIFCDDAIRRAIVIDYYYNSKTRLKRLFEQSISIQEKKEILACCLMNDFCSQEQFYRYTTIVSLYSSYLVILYHHNISDMLEIGKS